LIARQSCDSHQSAVCRLFGRRAVETSAKSQKPKAKKMSFDGAFLSMAHAFPIVGLPGGSVDGESPEGSRSLKVVNGLKQDSISTMKEKNSTPELNTTVSSSARSPVENRPQTKAARAKSFPALESPSAEARRRSSAPVAHAVGTVVRRRQSGLDFFSLAWIWNRLTRPSTSSSAHVRRNQVAADVSIDKTVMGAVAMESKDISTGSVLGSYMKLRSTLPPHSLLVHLPITLYEADDIFAMEDILTIRKLASELERSDLSPKTQFNRGVKYEFGDDVQIDYVEAVRCYQFAAELGLAEAQANLGSMFINGRGVQSDREAGFHWFLQAANQGFDYAQFTVGVMYEKGLNVEQDYDEARWFYRFAAEQGCAKAQCNLGNLYFTGRGVEVDNDEALFWFELAAQKGHPQAADGAMYLQTRRL